MKKKYLAFSILAIILSSCSSDNEQDNGEVYLSDGCLYTEPTTVLPGETFSIPQVLLDALKPEQKAVVSEVTKDTLDLKTTITDYRLVLRDLSAELTVNTQAKMQVREMRKTASYYVFKAGLYDVNGTAVEVRADGIYLVGNGDQVLKLENYRFIKSSENEVVSSSYFTKRYTTIAKGEAFGNTFMVSKSDTTYRCSRISEKKIRLDMVSPEQWECTTLDKQ